MNITIETLVDRTIEPFQSILNSTFQRPLLFNLKPIELLKTQQFTPSPISALATLSTLVNFDPTTGLGPSNLTISNDNEIYGASTSSIYKFSPEINRFTILANLGGTNIFPFDLTLGDNNKIYGTNFGNSTQKGSISKLDLTTGKLSNIAKFDGGNGNSPYAKLIIGNDGLLYGTTYGGGGNLDGGTIFSLNPSTKVLNTIVNFSLVSDGDGLSPVSLIQGLDGKIYGATQGLSDGSFVDFSTFFVLDTTTPLANLRTLFTFSGNYPLSSSLVMDAAGRIYGTTISQTFNGSIYRFDPNLGTLETLIEFNGQNGRDPYASLVEGQDGNFYGTTFYGGVNNLGTVFQLKPNTNQLTTLVEFDLQNGAYPASNLVVGSDGSLYGTTIRGGSNNFGTFFKLELTP
jgi:uncharacterized repeat protein (TIGR03803 family)